MQSSQAERWRIANGVTTPLVRDAAPATPPEKQLLFISYAFPPTGGGGVQRSVKFVKYLPTCGWQPTVLTVSNPSVPVQDEDLHHEVDPSVKILHARTLEPAYRLKAKLGTASSATRWSPVRSLIRRLGMQLLQPDPQVLWNPGAMRTACRGIEQQALDAIYVTGPPFSSFLLGRALKRRFGLPLVVDFRDEWILASEHLDNYRFGRFSRRRQVRMMRSVLRAADAVITTTQSSARELQQYARYANARPIIRCIYNGYDPDDFEFTSLSPALPVHDRLKIVYTGTLWKLTDIAPLVESMKQLAAMAPDAAGRVELVLAGRRTPQQDAIVRQLHSTPITVHCHDYLPHRKSLQLAASADVLLLLLADQAGAQRVVPAKLFEYMALAKPILSIGPDGETQQLLRQHGHPHRFLPDQCLEIANWMLAHVPVRRGANRIDLSPDPNIQSYSRPNLTRELAELLRQVDASVATR